MSRLKDSWNASGTDWTQFKNEIKALAERTFVKKCAAEDIMLMSKNTDALPDDADEEKNFYTHLISPKDIWVKEKRSKSGEVRSVKLLNFSKKTFVDRGGQELIDEYEKSTKTLIGIDKILYYVSPKFFNSLGARTGLSGAAAAEPCLERDLLFAKRLSIKEEAKEEEVSPIVSLVYREENKNKKLFAILSDRYSYIPQNYIISIVEKIISDGKLGSTKCDSWYIDNSISRVYLEFPDEAKEISEAYELEDEYVPGLLLESSDVGVSSLTVYATCRCGHSVLPFGKIYKRHTGKIDIEKICEQIDSKIFPEYRKLPERMCELLAVDVEKPMLTISNLFEEIELEEIIGQRNTKYIKEKMEELIDPDSPCTMYDIISQVIQLPAITTGLSATAQNKLVEAIKGAPYVDYDSIVDIEPKATIKVEV